jgi:hypothetical protein
MWWRLPHNPTPYDDDWEDQPGQGPLYQWGLGAAVPLLVLGYGIYVVATGHAEYGRVAMRLHGVNATAFGTAAISAAVFLHCHYFWGNLYDQAWFAVLGKIVAACGFIGGLGVLIVRVGVLGVG